MKKLGLVLVFLICFGAVDGFCNGNGQRIKEIKTTVEKIDGTLDTMNATLVKIDERLDKPTPTPPDPTVRPVPITREIINAVKTNNQDLGKLGYYLSAPLTLAVSNQNYEGTTINTEGAFILKENNTSSELKISTDVKGTLATYSPEGKEQFEVLFSLTNPIRTVTLTFERNEQKNSFDFAYAKDAGKTYVLSTNKDGPVPQLSIFYNYIIDNQNSIVAVQGIPPVQTTEPEVKTPDPQRDIAVIEKDITIIEYETIIIQQRNPRTTASAPAPSPPRESQNSIRIEGRGSLEKNKIVNYIISQNRAASRSEVGNLIDAYIREAQREGINYDIAVAQMCFATDYLRNQQLINARNYAGFGAIGSTPVTYRNMDEGVRAHIQHLKWYANGKLVGTNVDKRYNILATNGYLGRAKTLGVLAGYWAPDNPNYGDGINRILRGLYGS
ncbi:MAG: glucosaminidase domain-containing protein [Treponema sp.]|jgi:hypothetical protein|nr:glucosaminidase domain-containing protein [Treponema sp.]